ncbi:hypothetical protein Harman_39340 [Haloarcula mannanilytica]|uniref:Uncharacterized protein n=1 Tax=Haloarcula mannanilytica TaxID=2509225 RepID=A0A4C2EUX0_9EURY|nr:hypothetical protein Harman_39340 [Haloarcula mannanilytica]
MCVGVGQLAGAEQAYGWCVTTARDADGTLRSAHSRASLRSIVPAVAGAIPDCHQAVETSLSFAGPPPPCGPNWNLGASNRIKKSVS